MKLNIYKLNLELKISNNESSNRKKANCNT